MRKRDVVGRRIVDVEQTYVATTPTRRGYWAFDSLVLDDGRRVYVTVVETGTDYDAKVHVTDRPPRPTG